MARVKNIFYAVAILTSANSIVAEEGSGHSYSDPPTHYHNGGSNNGKQNPFGNMMDGFASFSNVGGSGGTPFGGLGGSGSPFSGFSSGNPFGGLGGGGSGNPISGFVSAFGLPSFGSRQENISGPEFEFGLESHSDDKSREVNKKPKGESDSSSQSDEPPESRFFFSSLFNTRLMTCNYTIQAGATCSSCREVLRCRPNNVGTVRRCGLFFPYCNNGRCSLFPGTACNTTTVTAAVTTTAAATTTTNAATTNAPTTQ